MECILIGNHLTVGDVDSQVPLSSLGCNARENPFITIVEHVTFSNSSGHWAFKQLKRLAVPHGIDYASILSPGKSLCLIAREPLALIYDSHQSVEVSQKDITDVPIYQWCEDPEEVTLWLIFDKKTSKQDVTVEITATSIKVTYKNQVKVEGNLFEKISADSSLWTLSDGKLEIILSKSVKALNWDYLIQHDSAGMKVSDAQAAHEWHQRLINMTTEEMVWILQERKSQTLCNNTLRILNCFQTTHRSVKKKYSDIIVKWLHLFSLFFFLIFWNYLKILWDHFKITV